MNDTTNSPVAALADEAQRLIKAHHNLDQVATHKDGEEEIRLDLLMNTVRDFLRYGAEDPSNLFAYQEREG